MKLELAASHHPGSNEYKKYFNEAEKNRVIALEKYQKLSMKYRLIFNKNRYEELKNWTSVSC